MRTIRTYTLSRDVLYCTVSFVSDQADFQDDYHFEDPDYREIKLSCVVGPSARRKDDFKVSAFRCSRQLVMDEIQQFLDVVRKMYSI